MIEEFSGDFLQQLRGFYYVAQLGSMGQAAKVMHRSQSSVSRLIKQLEESLGVDLFSRVQKGVMLTSEGSELFTQAVAIFESIRSIHSELGRTAKEPCGNVSFQVSHSAFVHFIAPLLPKFHASHPKIKLNILEAVNFLDLQKRLEDRKMDFALAVGGDLHESLDFFVLFKDKMVMLAPPQFKDKLKSPLNLDELPELPLIKLPGGSGFSIFVENHLPAAWNAARETVVAGNMYYQLNMVSAGLGFGITTASSLRLAKDVPLAVFPLDHIMPCQEYGLVSLKSSYVTPQARVVMKFLRDNCQE